MIPILIVANRVVQREKHTLNGATLDVSLENPDRNKDVEKTIKITGLAPKTTKDSIWNYFENKRRSGGGEVESLDFQSDTGVAFVTFVNVDGKYFKIILKIMHIVQRNSVSKHNSDVKVLLALWCKGVNIVSVVTDC